MVQNGKAPSPQLRWFGDVGAMFSLREVYSPMSLSYHTLKVFVSNVSVRRIVHANTTMLFVHIVMKYHFYIVCGKPGTLPCNAFFYSSS